MGLLMDMRSGKRDQFGLGAYALMFWFLAGAAVGAGVGAHAGGGSGNVVLAGCIAAVIGLCVGAYAAFGNTRLAKGLAIPGLLIAMLLFWV
jgi:hypothetical protein